MSQPTTTYFSLNASPGDQTKVMYGDCYSRFKKKKNKVTSPGSAPSSPGPRPACRAPHVTGTHGPLLCLTAVFLARGPSSTAGSPRSTVPCTSSCSVNVGRNRSHFYMFPHYLRCPGLGPTSLLSRVHTSVLGTRIGPPGSTRVPHPSPGPRAGPSVPSQRRHMPCVFLAATH